MATFDVTTFRHKRPVVPLRFPTEEPEEEHLGQSKRHLGLCMALVRILEAAVGAAGSVGGDQFVYWNGADGRRVLAPDGFVKFGPRDPDFTSWKTWERGTPEVAFEILSPSDTKEPWSLEEKIVRYHELGVRELFVFDVEAAPGERLRAWDRIDDDFVERVVDDERSPSAQLGLWIVVAPTPDWPAALRLARDEAGRALVLLGEEEASAAREEASAAREELRAAQARVAALEAELARRS